MAFQTALRTNRRLGREPLWLNATVPLRDDDRVPPFFDADTKWIVVRSVHAVNDATAYTEVTIYTQESEKRMNKLALNAEACCPVMSLLIDAGSRTWMPTRCLAPGSPASRTPA